ncbi:hypothetical protein [Delftia tsuruhatensis]|uniref:hypothetical protein n=1 Tax=Delftia tsuruhatensis TaxID=180282 RepID=UPI0028AD821C|nr:hypothetical protein [Delftia tsuruhatensis]
MLMDQVLELKTNERVLAAMRNAAARAMSAAESMEQRVSFVYGSVSKDNTVTKEQVREVIRAQVGAAAERSR